MKDDMRMTRCCFTGHRPPALKRPEDDIRVDLENSILTAVSEGFTTFISGMACGVDIWAAEIVIRLKIIRPDLHLIAAIPCPGFDEGWDEDWRGRYRFLLSRAEYVKVLASTYSGEACQKRNEWMVDHSAKVIAVYNGQPGGTLNTVRYARLRRVPIRFLQG